MNVPKAKHSADRMAGIQEATEADESGNVSKTSTYKTP